MNRANGLLGVLDLECYSESYGLDVTGGELHALPTKLDGKIGMRLTERQVNVR